MFENSGTPWTEPCFCQDLKAAPGSRGFDRTSVFVNIMQNSSGEEPLQTDVGTVIPEIAASVRLQLEGEIDAVIRMDG